MRTLLLAALLTVPASAGPFRPLDFKAAKRAAAIEGKSLFVFAVSDGCPPCEAMKRTTFKDPAVLELLANETVAFEFNADRLPALGEELRVTAYPTMIFFSPGGKQLDRLTGFHDAKAFTAAYRDAVAGRTTVDRAREAVDVSTGGRPLVRARHDLAVALAGAGRSREALAEYVWLYDWGTREDPSFADLRRFLVPIEMAGLGRSYRPAIEALRERRKALEARLKTPAKHKDDAGDLKSLNRALGESDMAANKP